jgi:hypothetical protein
MKAITNLVAMVMLLGMLNLGAVIPAAADSLLAEESVIEASDFNSSSAFSAVILLNCKGLLTSFSRPGVRFALRFKPTVT